MRNHILVFFLAATLAGVGARTAGASPVAGLPAPTIDINGTPLDAAALGCASPGGGGPTFCSGTGLTGTGFLLSDWSFLLNPDPSITSNFTLTNISAVTQPYILTITLPIALVGPAISITGSTGGALTDLNANGATATDNGAAIYSARVNGTSLQTLLDPPQLFVAPVNPTGGPSSVPIGPVGFGPTVLPQSADVNMSMRIQFTLTPGDQVQLTSVFDIQPAQIPEPGTVLLLGSGLAGLVAFRRRV